MLPVISIHSHVAVLSQSSYDQILTSTQNLQHTEQKRVSVLVVFVKHKVKPEARNKRKKKSAFSTGENGALLQLLYHIGVILSTKAAHLRLGLESDLSHKTRLDTDFTLLIAKRKIRNHPKFFG